MISRKTNEGSHTTTIKVSVQVIKQHQEGSSTSRTYIIGQEGYLTNQQKSQKEDYER